MFGGLGEVGGWEGLEGWPRKKIALKEPDILLGQPGVFRQSFDPFCDEVDAEFKTCEADGSNDSLTGTGAVDGAGEAHVEFDLIGFEIGEKVEVGMRRAEVVDRQPDAQGPVLLEQGREVRGVFDDEGLRNFENEAMEREVRFAGGFEGGEDRLWIGFEALGEKIQVEGAVDLETGGESDGCGSRGLIEEMEAEWGDLVEDLPRGLVPFAANQSFPGDDFACDGVDDGLKGKAEGRVGDEVDIGAHSTPAGWGRDGVARLNCCGWSRGGGRLGRTKESSRLGGAGTTPRRGYGQWSEGGRGNSEGGAFGSAATDRPDRNDGQKFGSLHNQ